MLNRRTAIANVLGLAALPSLPAAAARPSLGSAPVHSEAAFRRALTEHLDAYRVWRLTPNYPNFEVFEELRLEFVRASCRLEAMVLENTGTQYDTGKRALGMACPSVDLGDVLIVVTAEHTSDSLNEQCTLVALVPKSPEMFALLDGLPKQSAPNGPRSADQIRKGEEARARYKASEAEKTRRARVAAELGEAMKEAWAADKACDEREYTNDVELAAASDRQDVAWERVRSLVIEWRGLPEDFTGDHAFVLDDDLVITLCEDRGAEPPASWVIAGVDFWNVHHRS
jgi:hypothetical protein